MDVETVIVYSTEDKNSLAVMAADKAVCIGPAKAAESYLNQDAIIETAILTGCEAVHGNNLGMIYCKAPFDPELVASSTSTFYTGVDYFMQPSLRNMGFSIKVQF